ncbi:unnamed protein product [Heligmosomoides polygyrus]|uniref:Uncharacterized protein n=1 Tax=Heligmosomoides polygyrus TaxID=6339 RepID=A0A183FLC1_HELPZ|nr:unnamed protein product [Heligmosomoides polygyrus]
MSDPERENGGDDASILRKMAWGQVDVEVIGVEVMDDLLHGSSEEGGGSVRTSESGHLDLEAGDVPATFHLPHAIFRMMDASSPPFSLPRSDTDAQLCLCSFSQYFRTSLFEIFLYRRYAQLRKLGHQLGVF